MAEVKSGSFSTSGYSDSGYPDHYVFSWSLVSQSIIDNTSTISWSLYAAGGSSSGRYTEVKEKYVTVNGTTKSSTAWQTTYNNTTPFSGTTVITHNSTGKGSFSASAGGAFYYSGSYNSTGSGSWDLPTIARATDPKLSATSITANGSNSVTMTITPADASFKHKIRYEFGSLVSQIAGISISSKAIDYEFTTQGNLTATFTPPRSLCEQIPNAMSAKCKLILYTYNSSGSHIGTVEKEITLNVPDYTPTISNITLTGNNLLSGAYVQGKSTVRAVITANSELGASIKSYSSTVDGKTYTGNDFTSSVLSNGSKSVSVTVTDTRGKTATKSSTITVYEYTAPTITSFTLERQTDGTTVIATVKGTVSAVNNKNAKTITVAIGDGTPQTITSSGYTINGTTTFTNVDTDKTLTFTAKIADSYTSATKEAVLPTVAVTMDFHNSGKGIALGKVAEGEGLEVAWKSAFNKAISIKDDALATLTLKRNHTYNGAAVKFENDTDTLGYIGMYGNAVDRHLRRWKSDASESYIMLDTGNLTDHIKDYVVEQGVKGEWNYAKWNNGKSEAWRKVELGDVPLTSALAGGVYSSTSYNGRGITLPSGLFVAIPLAFANVYSNGYTHCQVASATTEQIVYRLWSPYSATITGVIVSLYVVGRWK